MVLGAFSTATATASVLTGLKALENGGTSQMNEFETAAGRLEDGGNDVDQVCATS